MSSPSHFKLNHRAGLLVWICVGLFAATAGAEFHKVRVSDPALAQSLVAQGAEIIGDYGSFQMIEVDDSKIAGLAPNRAQLADDHNIIQLNARPLDTRQPAAKLMRRMAGSFAGKRLHLVHFAGPVKPEWIEALKQTGATVVGHIPHNAFLIYGNAASLAQIQSWAQTASCVQWEGEYADDFKIHPRARTVDEKGQARAPGTDLFVVQMLDDADANPATMSLIDRLKLEPVKQDFRILHYRNVIVRLPPGQLSKLAAQPEVVSIQPRITPRKQCERQAQIVAGHLTAGIPDGPGYLEWLAERGFTQAQFDASGFVVDVSDSGIDNGTVTPGHFGLYQLGNPGLSSRVVYSRTEGSTNNPSTLEGTDGHGTLNAHIIAGDVPLTNGFPHTDAAGYRYGLGICPFVKVGASVIFDPEYFTYPSYTDLQADAYNDGARISANSWGASSWGEYDYEAQTYDALVRDAQPEASSHPTAGNQQMVIVFAAGNDGPTASSIGTPGSAKNVITVGASENVLSLATTNDPTGNDGCDALDTEADNANDMVGFSSRGPCVDGRMKPDLVAPGTHIAGGVAQMGSPTTNGLGLANSNFTASGICALAGKGSVGNPFNFFPPGQEFYSVSSGTSHSTPAVAGACALLRQLFINQGRSAPSPAMTKAWLINSTRYLTGAGANDNRWSPGQGMGALNIGMALDDSSRLVHDQITYEKFTTTGQTRTYEGMIADASKPFRVTLAWTDAPGTTSGNAFNNDLDLTVTAGGSTYKGNVFSGAYSIADGDYDGKNNVESVFLPAGLSGEFQIIVTAANINSDGVPNEEPALDQDFALVAFNAQETMVSVIEPDGLALVSESHTPTNGAVDPGETVTVAIALKNIGSLGTTSLVATLLETNGVYAPNGPQHYGVIPPAAGVVTQSFTFTAQGTCGGTICPTLHLQDGPSDLGIASFSLNLGKLLTTTTLATNSLVISTPASGTIGPASPYPSSLSISGITGTVSRVTVTLTSVTHSYPDDLDVLLVGPSGTNVMLLSDCGGANELNDVTLTFDDTATGSLPDTGLILSGTYKPTNFDATDSFPTPAPAAPFGQQLSVFNGLNPNGTWSLYIQDDSGQDAGIVAQGWKINIMTSDAVCTGQVNQPPVLSTIANRTVHAGGTVIVTNTATDPDIPTNKLSFSLGTNAPANATIDTNSGVFTWTTSRNLMGTTNSITVRVTDNGLPPLSDAKTFAVVVVPPPLIQSVSLTNNNVRMTWSAISGQTYRLQYKGALEAAWSDLPTDVTATGSSASRTDPINSQTRRFYRVMVLP